MRRQGWWRRSGSSLVCRWRLVCMWLSTWTPFYCTLLTTCPADIWAIFAARELVRARIALPCPCIHAQVALGVFVFGQTLRVAIFTRNTDSEYTIFKKHVFYTKSRHIPTPHRFPHTNTTAESVDRIACAIRLSQTAYSKICIPEREDYSSAFGLWQLIL